MKISPKQWPWKLIIGISLLSFAIGFFYQFHLPQLKRVALVKIEQLSEKYTPVRVWPTDIEFKFLPLGVRLIDVRILPKKELAEQLAPLKFSHIDADLNIISLIQGKFRLSELSFHEATVTWIQKTSEILDEMSRSEAKDIQDATKKLKLNLDWDAIYKTPIDTFSLKDINIQVKVKTPEISTRINKLSLSLHNRYKAILVKVETDSIMVKKSNKSPVLDVGLDAQVLIEDKGIRVAGLKVIRKNSYIVASGIVSGDITKLEFNDAKVKARSHFQLSEVRSSILEFFPKLTIPTLFGSADIDINLVNLDGLNSTADFRLSTRGIKIDQFIVGKVDAQGRVKNKEVKLKTTSIENSAGKVSAHDTELSLGDEIKFATKLEAQNLEITQLLVNLDIPRIPMHLLVNGPLPCNGTIQPKFNLSCEGEVSGSELKVQNKVTLPKDSTASPPLTIVAIKDFKAKGKVTVDTEKVTYKSDITLKNFEGGYSEGVISYSKGFDISYKANKALFHEVDTLAELDIYGSAKLSGKTTGDSNSATFFIDAQGSDLQLEKFKLGNANFRADYKSGTLAFKEIRGKLGSSRYSGKINLELLKDRLSINVNVPYLDVDDVERSIASHWKLPISVSGTGSAKVAVSGPYELRKLDFDIKSDIFRGELAGESFDVVHLDFYAKNQQIKSRRISVHRGDSQVELQGTVDKNDRLDGVAIGRSLRIEQFENISNLDLNLSGIMDVTLKLSNTLADPLITVNGRITNMIVGDQPAKESHFKFKTNSEKMIGSASFIGDIIKTNFQIPISEKVPLKIYIKTNKWDFSHLFNIFSNVAFRQNYVTDLTSEFFLDSATGKIEDGRGRLFVEHFKIQRGPIYMATNGPGYLEYNSGRFKSKDFKLYGKDTYLELFARKLAESEPPLNLSIRGKVDLSLASLLTPFLGDLRGRASVNIDSSGEIFDPDIRGSIYLQDGLVVHPDFPHPFTEINADILFNKKNMLINSLKGKVAEGSFSAEGQIRFLAWNKIPVDVRGNMDQVHLNIPDGFQTQGSGNLFLKGETFPYLFGGLYKITGGEVKKDFDVSEKSIKRVQPSHFLPKFLTKESFSPIILDLDVAIQRPLNVNIVTAGTEVQASVLGDIKVTNTLESPLLTGKVKTTGEGKFTFRTNEFNIRDALISFQKSTPDSPTVNVSAYSRVKEYDIDLLLTGSAQNPRVNLSSQPQLPETEILSLLALGMTTQESDSTGAFEATAENTSFQITSALINQQLGLGKEINKRLGVKFEISSDYDAEEATSVHRFTFKKQWTPKFGASASRSIGANPINKFKVEYKLSNELSLIGNYENQEQSEQTRDTTDKLGLDLEYKVQFGN
ncbi:MAG: translocation/assembly module TamB domain-containing protein [Bdellovibrionales bacterium]|nr:translocation/assembly module TamB domain-containing protein [Bdellovibrionales bacterium]